MLRDWHKRFPGRIETMFRAMSNLVPAHLLDTSAYDFVSLAATGIADANGDTVFDTAAIADAKLYLKPFAFHAN